MTSTFLPPSFSFIHLFHQCLSMDPCREIWEEVSWFWLVHRGEPWITGASPWVFVCGIFSCNTDGSVHHDVFFHSLSFAPWLYTLATFGWGCRRTTKQKINLFPSMTLFFSFVSCFFLCLLELRVKRPSRCALAVADKQTWCFCRPKSAETGVTSSGLCRICRSCGSMTAPAKKL